MFVQVLQGKVEDQAGVDAALDRWRDELAAGAQGWLGTTDGVTDNGDLANPRIESPSR